MVFGLLGIITPCFSNLPELSSDEPIEFDENTKEVIAKGKAILLSDNLIVEADEIRFDREEFDAKAKGHVKITGEGFRFVGNEAIYNFCEKTLASDCFRTGRLPLYFEGAQASGHTEDIHILHPKVYFGEPDPYAPNIKAFKANIRFNEECHKRGRITGKHIFFRIGRIPIAYFPYYSHSLRDLPFSLKSDYGFSKEYGVYARNTIFVDTTPCLRTGALLDYYEKRGPLFGPALQYASENGCSFIHGELQSAYIHDQGNKTQLGTDSLGRPIKRDRYFIEFYHQQTLTERLQFTGQLRAWSDSQVVRDFRPKIFAHDNDPDNFAEIVYRGDCYFLTAFTRFSPNNFQTVKERLPELNFHLMPNRIGCTPFFQNLNATIAHLHKRDPSLQNSELRSDRLDLYYGLKAPFGIMGSTATFVPVIGGRISQYFDKNTSKGPFTRYKAQIGFDAQLNSYAQWNCCNKTWNINGLRHIARPTLSYRYIPEAHSGTGPIPEIDTAVFTTNIQPIDLSYQRNKDDGNEMHTVRLGFENILQTRHPEYGSRELATLQIYQDYSIIRNSDGSHWSDLYSELAIFPAYWLRLSIYNRIDLPNGKFKDLQTSICLIDARHWSLSFHTDFIDMNNTKRNQYHLMGTWNIDPRSSISACWRYDALTKQFTEETYKYRTMLGNSWDVEAKAIHRRGSNIRESKWEFVLVFTLIPFNAKLFPIKI